MKLFSFVLLAILFAEYSCQTQWDLGAVSQNVEVGDAVPEKYPNLTDLDIIITNDTRDNANAKWEELVTSKDPASIQLDPIVFDSGYTLNATNIVITGLSGDKLENLEVRTDYDENYWWYARTIRVDVSTSDPLLVIAADFELTKPDFLLSGNAVISLTNVTNDVGLLATRYLPVKFAEPWLNFTVIGAQSNYTFGDVTVQFVLDKPNLTDIRDDNKDDVQDIIRQILEAATLALLPKYTDRVNAVIPNYVLSGSKS